MGYSSTIRLFPENDTAVVVLSSLRYINITNIGEMAYNAVMYNIFDSVGFDLHNWTDLGFTLVTISGVVYFFLFVRLLIGVNGQLRGGAVITPNFSREILKGSFGLIFAIAGLVFYYIFPYVLMDTTRESLLRNWPVSFGIAAIAIWINILYDAFAWWVKFFISPKTQ